MNIFRAFVCFFLPSCVIRLISKIIRSKKIVLGKNAKIGFSFIVAESIVMDDNTSVGHFNYVNIKRLHFEKGGSIKHLNFIKGDFSIFIGENAWIRTQNKISATRGTYHDVNLVLDKYAKIGVKQLLDMTDSITIGESSMLAGADTQIWTHSFLFSKTEKKYARIDSPVVIGKHCYIGARCTILSGVNIADAITVGACTCVSKSLNVQGLYTSQDLKYKKFDPDERMESLGRPVMNTFIYRK